MDERVTAGLGVALGAIPREAYADYRYEVIFSAYKWDPQVGDQNTVARHALLMDPDTAGQLERWAEQLSEETMRMEEALIGRVSQMKELGLSPKMRKALEGLQGYDRDHHIRLMRFDFHPTQKGWALSEVNSDVPGGFAEGSVLPAIAGQYFDGYAPRGHTGDTILDAFHSKVKEGGTIAFVYATSYADDRQVMQYLGDSFENAGYRALYAAPDHIRWAGGKAEGIAGIVRFYPLEWMENLPGGSDWHGYFRSETPSCNHPVAMLTQSKRLPLIWDELGVDAAVWKSLLPETADPRDRKGQASGAEWIFKPALGRVGEGISIRGAVTEKEVRQIQKAAKKHPLEWAAQKMFHSQPLETEGGALYHACVGVFTVDGKSAGFYGRISPYPRIDAKAMDVPILVKDVPIATKDVSTLVKDAPIATKEESR
jgi:glutathionylspermidine synthase